MKHILHEIFLNDSINLIEKKYIEIIDKRWLRGVISMPSNIFANTGTNVSVLFIDKTNSDGNVLLMDASKLGEKVKIGKGVNKRDILLSAPVAQNNRVFVMDAKGVVSAYSIFDGTESR